MSSVPRVPGILFVVLLAMAPLTACETDDSSNQGGGGDCATFCEDMVAACPEDDTVATCTHSCEGADVAPTAAALACAQAASDCSTARACWSHLFTGE